MKSVDSTKTEPSEQQVEPKKKAATPLGAKETKEPEKVQLKSVDSTKTEPSEQQVEPKKKAATPLGAKETKEPEKVQLKSIESTKTEPSEPQGEPKKKAVTPSGPNETKEPEKVPKTGGNVPRSAKLRPEKAELINQVPSLQLKKLGVTEAVKPGGGSMFEETKKLLKPIQVGTRCSAIAFPPRRFSSVSLITALVDNNQCWPHR